MRFNIYSARHLSQDICPPISQIVLKNFIKISLIIKECPEEIFIKLAIVWLKHCFYILLSKQLYDLMSVSAAKKQNLKNSLKILFLFLFLYQVYYYDISMFKSLLWRDVLHTTLCAKVCQ
jgi:hypothetical protein